MFTNRQVDFLVASIVMGWLPDSVQSLTTDELVNWIGNWRTDDGMIESDKLPKFSTSRLAAQCVITAMMTRHQLFIGNKGDVVRWIDTDRYLRFKQKTSYPDLSPLEISKAALLTCGYNPAL